MPEFSSGSMAVWGSSSWARGAENLCWLFSPWRANWRGSRYPGGCTCPYHQGHVIQGGVGGRYHHACIIFVLEQNVFCLKVVTNQCWSDFFHRSNAGALVSFCTLDRLLSIGCGFRRRSASTKYRLYKRQPIGIYGTRYVSFGVHYQQSIGTIRTNTSLWFKRYYRPVCTIFEIICISWTFPNLSSRQRISVGIRNTLSIEPIAFGGYHIYPIDQRIVDGMAWF